MTAAQNKSPYQLLDMGEGRKLEQFGSWILDRPCPAANAFTKSDSSLWQQATAQFTGENALPGVWRQGNKPWKPSKLTITIQANLPRGIAFHLAPLPSGQVGLFPEQQANWQWIDKQIRRAKESLKILNLFAYTGGSTLAAALAGAQITHVDAAKSAVFRARENATASTQDNLKIRWIVEDVTKFCQREVRRGNQYDAVILDPPSYGHGPQGEPWSIQRDLLPLLNLCGQLTADRRVFVLVTCHTPGIGPAELSAYLGDGIFGHCGQPARTGMLNLKSTTERLLPSGVYARWPG